MNLEVTYESRGRARRTFTARFELGSDDANMQAALEHAWRMNARVIGQRAY